MSLNTVGSAEDSVFFDAEDGGLEFVDFDGQENSRPDNSDDSESDEEEAEAREAARSIARTPLDHASSIPADSKEDPAEPKTPTATRRTGLAIEVPDRPQLGSVLSNVSSASTVSLRSPGGEPLTPMRKVNIVRRTRLPAPTSGEQMSLFTMLKRNIGKVRFRLIDGLHIFVDLNMLASSGSSHRCVSCHVCS